MGVVNYFRDIQHKMDRFPWRKRPSQVFVTDTSDFFSKTKYQGYPHILGMWTYCKRRGLHFPNVIVDSEQKILWSDSNWNQLDRKGRFVVAIIGDYKNNEDYVPASDGDYLFILISDICSFFGVKRKFDKRCNFSKD